MKKSFLLIVCAVALLLGFSSCGGNSEEKALANITLIDDYHLKYMVTVLGDDTFFEPIAGVYPVTEADGKLQVTIEFEKSKNTKSKNYIAREFSFKPEDVEENRLEYDDDYIEFKAENRQNALKELLNAQVGDHIKVTFIYMPADEVSKKEILEKIHSCGSIHLYLQEDENAGNDEKSKKNDGEEDDDDSSDNTSSTDWDSILDEYENYVDKIIALCNKINNGDMSAMSEYTSLLQSSQELNNKLTQGQGSMTSAQVARYSKISAKMANAAIKM